MHITVMMKRKITESTSRFPKASLNRSNRGFQSEGSAEPGRLESSGTGVMIDLRKGERLSAVVVWAHGQVELVPGKAKVVESLKTSVK